jgi:uncharacterized protein (TIGR03067 family)
MNTRKHFITCGLTILLLAAIAGCGKSKTEKAAEKTGMEGRWTGFDMTRPAEACKVTITGNQLEYRGAQTNDWCIGSFVLNDSAQLRQMDLTIQGPPEIAGRKMLFIYDLQGDEMKVAGVEPGSPLRPATFTSSRQTRVWSFKRD